MCEPSSYPAGGGLHGRTVGRCRYIPAFNEDDGIAGPCSDETRFRRSPPVRNLIVYYAAAIVRPMSRQGRGGLAVRVLRHRPTAKAGGAHWFEAAVEQVVLPMNCQFDLNELANCAPETALIVPARLTERPWRRRFLSAVITWSSPCWARGCAIATAH